MTRLLSLIALAVLAMPLTIHAADVPPAAVENPMAQVPNSEMPVVEPEAAPADTSDLARRVELSKQWHKLMPVPVREQVNAAIDQSAQSQPENTREIFKANMKNALNYDALEKISIDAMAETYSATELEAMVEYYSKPEAKSAQAKYDAYANKVFPEIRRMLDQALMRARTGGTGQ